MILIDSIIDLARSIEPAYSKVEPKFKLERDREGNWLAEVQMITYYCDGKGSTADEALTKLRDELISVNKKISETILQRLARWVTGDKNPQPKLKLIKEDKLN